MTDVRRTAVLGAGTMGHGIAQTSARAGYETILYDLSEELVRKGLEQVVANLDKGVAKRKVSQDERDATLARLSTSTDLEQAVGTADLVIEAVPERLDLKRELFSRVEAAAPARAILASNTSSLSIARLCEGLRRPEHFLGMHFFNPVHVMALLEIVVHEGTSEATLEAARQVGRAMAKTPIVVKDSPGFATSRLGIVLGLEAMRMLEAGVASAEDIDAAMELGYRHPMGPLRLTDLVGLDVRLGIAEYLHRELGAEAFRPPEILRRMVAEGKLGKKSGQGFYDWSHEA